MSSVRVFRLTHERPAKRAAEGSTLLCRLGPCGGQGAYPLVFRYCRFNANKILEKIKRKIFTSSPLPPKKILFFLEKVATSRGPYGVFPQEGSISNITVLRASSPRVNATCTEYIKQTRTHISERFVCWIKGELRGSWRGEWWGISVPKLWNPIYRREPGVEADEWVAKISGLRSSWTDSQT